MGGNCDLLYAAWVPYNVAPSEQPTTASIPHPAMLPAVFACSELLSRVRWSCHVGVGL